MLTEHFAALFGIFYAAVELCGIMASIDAIMTGRTTQGAIAWAIALVSFPLLALPLYLVFGRSKFHGYVSARRAGDLEINHIASDLADQLKPFAPGAGDPHGAFQASEALARMPFTTGNRAELLIDGQATFDAIFKAIESAKRYVLVQFFIVHDDMLGRELAERLIRKAAEGIPIYFLYDAIGSRKLGSTYLDPLKKAGVRLAAFHTTRGWNNRFRLNFRNHRKIVIADGTSAYVGGLNVGDAYMGRSKKFGPWRDTHVALQGPAVQCVQLSFIEDWYWATHQVPPLDWTPRPSKKGCQPVLVLPSGPADDVETCALFFIHAINRATRRIWIASPYFVPDRPVISALLLAAMRGVDVRIMLPQNPDHLLVYWSAFSYIAETEPVGVKFYRYQPGFMHHKVMLIDDAAATVGTANLDNRSFRINFEITILFADPDFARRLKAMLEDDFSRCRQATASDFHTRPLWFKVAVNISRLLAPIQ